MDTARSLPSLPPWLTEAAEVLHARARVVVATALGLTFLGAIVAMLAPGLLPPRPVVGAAVGLAAALLATALGLAVDAADLVVRGQRHVTAAGGVVRARVARDPADVGPVLARVAEHARDGRVRVALTPASRTAGVPGARAASLAEAVARTGRKVLLTDLTRGDTPTAGLSDVIAGERKLAEVVRFDQELYLARLAAGPDTMLALTGFAGWAEALPSDLEVLVTALPPLAEPGVIAAASAADVVLVLVEIDRTERVDLIASLDAIDAAGLTGELVLVDPGRTLAGSRPPIEEPDDLDPAPSAASDDELVAELTADYEDGDEPDGQWEAEEVLPAVDVPAEPEAEPVTAPEAPTNPEPVAERERVAEPDPIDEPEPEPDATAEIPARPVPFSSAPTPPAVISGPVPVPQPESDPSSASPADDEIDEMAREAVRQSAALQALAQEVWQRESGADAAQRR